MPAIPSPTLFVRRYPNWIMVGVGALTSLGFAPFYVLPFLLLGISYLFYCVQQSLSWKQAFKYGYAFGFGSFLTGTYWICCSMLVEPEKYWFLIPFALIAIPSVAALFGAIACAFSFVFRPYLLVFWVLFSFFWVALELVRSWYPFPFPWNLVGYGFMMNDTLSQAAAYVGVYGLSFLLVLMAGGIALLGHKKYVPFILSVCIFAGMWVGGDRRLRSHPTENTDVYMRIVQPNIDQKIKWNRAYYAQNFKTYLGLTAQKSAQKIDMIVWPEMATPFDLQSDAVARNLIESAYPNPGVYLLLGSARYKRNKQGVAEEFWNSLYVLNAHAQVSEIYDKNILVPFGEYIPFRRWLPIDKIEAMAMGSHSKDFSVGSGVKTLRVNGLPDVSPLICFEAVFSGHVARFEPDQKPEWLLNVTNDAWFGDTPGPRQHADMVRLRAIEEGVPMVRVAGTGISFVCDAYGRIVTSIPLNTQGVRDLYLPKALPDDTVYRKWLKKQKRLPL